MYAFYLNKLHEIHSSFKIVVWILVITNLSTFILKIIVCGCAREFFSIYGKCQKGIWIYRLLAKFSMSFWGPQHPHWKPVVQGKLPWPEVTKREWLETHFLSHLEVFTSKATENGLTLGLKELFVKDQELVLRLKHRGGIDAIISACRCKA